jgi:hypothetical protein
VGSENLAYALTQVVHNFGAVGVLGGAVFILWPAQRLEYARKIAWLILVAWGAQIASGGIFGAISLHYYGATPDLSAVALGALATKVAAAAAGFLLTALYLIRGAEWSRGGVQRTFRTLAALGVIALTAAAFLRWFS